MIWLFCCSVAESCPALCNPMDCSTPGFPVLHYLPGVCSNSYPLSQWCHPTISFSVTPFPSCPQFAVSRRKFTSIMYFIIFHLIMKYGDFQKSVGVATSWCIWHFFCTILCSANWVEPLIWLLMWIYQLEFVVSSYFPWVLLSKDCFQSFSFNEKERLKFIENFASRSFDGWYGPQEITLLLLLLLLYLKLRWSEIIWWISLILFCLLKIGCTGTQISPWENMCQYDLNKVTISENSKNQYTK